MDNAVELKKVGRVQGGYVLITTIVLGLALGALGLGFMRWSSYEALETNTEHAAMQAYYLAQLGLVDKGFTWLRSQLASTLPSQGGDIIFSGQELSSFNAEGWVRPRYGEVKIRPLVATEGGNFFSTDRIFRVSCVGTVGIPVGAGSGDEGVQDISRAAVVYLKVRSYADYMYLTDQELDRFGFTVRFQDGDILWGRVHSNSQIAIMGRPEFYDLVTTPADDFWRGVGYAPIFHGPDPIFHAPEVLIPTVAEQLRSGASSRGTYFDNQGYSSTWFVDVGGSSMRIHRWDTGSPIDTLENPEWTNLPISGDMCVFFTGPVWVKGRLTGRLTLGSAFDIRIVDDITYSDANPDGQPGAGSQNMLGLVSERDIKIANTPANGRENCNGGGRFNPNQAFCGVIISGALVALNESFTFENQNDPDSGYVCSCNPDERGYINLFGSVTQQRRGFVHRSTQGGSGYLKDYRYDARFLINRPPCFFDATDNQGRALFDVVQWGHAVDAPGAVPFRLN